MALARICTVDKLLAVPSRSHPARGLVTPCAPSCAPHRRLETAIAVGTRYGAPELLRADAARMHADTHIFRCSANGVWLAEAVPACHLEISK